MDRGAARNFVREGPVTDVIRFQTLAISHKDHFDVTGQLQQDMTSNVFYQSASINFNKDKKTVQHIFPMTTCYCLTLTHKS